ncbi:MAG: prolyl oligopeptidase family serine peptidase [Flavobacteriales bacterium]|nr:prolyl oligopeptidase family serine peptidase [Flavobacteriales bacterium]
MERPLRRTSIVFLIIFNTLAVFAQQEITLEDIWKTGKFRTEGVYGIRSLNDGKHYTTLQNSNVIKYSYESGDSVDAIVLASDLKFDGGMVTIDEYDFNKSETKLLLATEEDPVYRHSSSYKYYAYDRTDKKLREVAGGKHVFHATFSPVSNQVAYVKDNDLYVEDLDTKKTQRITSNGKKNEIINGMSDWVYEEEFAFTKAFQWSPDGRFIAYYEFNETEVKEFSMTKYEGQLYPSEERFKYPKAGEKNSKVAIYIYHVDRELNVKVEIGERDDIYIPRIKWTNDPSTLSIQRMNRLQNRLELLFADALKGKTRVVLSEISDTYIDITDNLTFLDGGQEFIWSSEKDGYNHLYLYDVAGNVKAQLTSGEWDVTDFYGIDAKGKNFYYQSSEEGPTQRHVYAASLNGNFKRKLTPNKGQNYPNFSKTNEYFINQHSDANTPPFISLITDKGKQLRVLKDNASLKKMLAEMNLPKKEFFSFTPSHGTSLNAWMIKPANFDPTQKYPVLVLIYGGPGSNTVNDAWGSKTQMWELMLAQQGYIIVSVDNRGTGNRGRDFKNCTYKQLGKLEVEDYIETAKYLGTLGYVNPARIGMYGWSYGGYMSSLALTKGADYYSMAIAVAPVTNWRFYDSIYTERYMRTPQENAKGYDDNSPINHVEKMKGAYLLVHGTGDDNVHFQNTVEMTEALIEANKQFELYIYPDRNHGIYGKNARLHLFTKMTDFIKKNL